MSMFDDYDEQAAKKAKQSAPADSDGPSADDSSSEDDSHNLDYSPCSGRCICRPFLALQQDTALYDHGSSCSRHSALPKRV